MRLQRGRAMEMFLALAYPWMKAAHIVSVIAWMAGLFYLPRLFVYHVERAGPSGEVHETFMVMEDKLLRVIMTPAMIASWVFGLALVFTPGIVSWSFLWPWLKGASLLAMTWFHFWCAARRRDFATGTNRLTGRRYRLMNEVPTLLMLIIVFAVVLKF